MAKTAEAKQPKTAKRKEGYSVKIAPKAISQTRADIAAWKAAERQVDMVDNPKRVKLHYLYRDIKKDALLTSQIENRKRSTIGSAFILKDKSGNIDEESTLLLKSASWFHELRGHINDVIYEGPTVIEFVTDESGLKVVLLPRTNIVPNKGLLLFDETNDKGIDYRTVKEYGTWVLEFGNPAELGLLNKVVPHVLFKRFAQSCWSELCEIYGIPPRVLKTNTQDDAMLARGEQMLRDMGAASWFIIDESETFEFAQGVSTKGEVYESLIKLCSNELCMAISGAIIGQDNKNGNQSKEKVSISILESLVDSDKRSEASSMNEKVLPALFMIGLLPEGLTYEYEPQEDLEQLYTRSIGFAPYVGIDPEWVKEKFGIEATGPKKQGGAGANFQ